LLDLAGAAVDLFAFDAAITRGDPRSLAEAVALYRGPLLEGCTEEWAFQERQVREQAYLAALEKLAAEAMAAGDAATAEGRLRQAAAVDPLRDSVQRALMAALAASGNYASVREAAAQLGHSIAAGISTGTVYAGAIGPERHRETTVVGPVVNLASRLQEHAGPGQILIGEATYHLTRRAFEFSPHSLAARGIVEPVVAHSVIRALARPDKARGIEGLRAPLIGRDEELTKLRAALARILPSGTPESEDGEAARGQIVSLIGEAGVGKSRLIAELKQGVGCRVWGVGSDGSDPTPYTLHPTPYTLHPTPFAPLVGGPLPGTGGDGPLLPLCGSTPSLLRLARRRGRCGSSGADCRRPAGVRGGLRRLRR
jgi:class 3 adenylate cyclase